MRKDSLFTMIYAKRLLIIFREKPLASAEGNSPIVEGSAPNSEVPLREEARSDGNGLAKAYGCSQE